MLLMWKFWYEAPVVQLVVVDAVCKQGTFERSIPAISHILFAHRVTITHGVMSFGIAD